jgi:class 3 adenylate cyclase
MEHPNRHRRWYEDLESFSRRVLTTVLFTDVVDSTGRVCELGDRSWTDVLRSHHARFRDRLSLFGGREVDAAGDGFLAAFDVPTHAVAFACAFHEGVVDLRLEVRTGVHTGECELEEGRLRGVAVHVGARLASLARPGEVLVSSTVRDVVAGSGLRFVDRGLHELRGVPGQRRLFAARRDESGAFTAARLEGRRAAAGVTHRRRPERLVNTADAG